MGIEKFYSSIINFSDAVTKNIKTKIDVEYFYIDFNSIVYHIAEIIENELNTLLYHVIINKITDTDREIIKLYKLEKSNDLINEISNADIIDITIKKIENFINMLCTDIINPNKLEKIFISIDGTPNMGKIWEQKKRRYSGAIIGKLQNIIYGKYKECLSENRIIYENNKFSFDRSLIGPNSNLMDKIVKVFEKKMFLKDLPYFENIIISNHDNPGEGEKKIMEDIIEKSNKGRYCIYSPDSDMVVLSIILQNIINCESSFCILRRDRNIDQYDHIDTSIVMKNIIGFIENIIGDKKFIEGCHKNITNDISFVITLFGNDFISKIETINVSLHIDLILTKYANVLKKLNSKYENYIRFLINNVESNYEINWLFLMEFFNELSYVEHFLYGDMYIEKNYNIQNFKKYVNTMTITETIYSFVGVINKYVFPNIYAYQQLGEREGEREGEKKKILFDTANNIFNYFEKSCKKTLNFLKYFINFHKFNVEKSELNFDEEENIKLIVKIVLFILSNFNLYEKHCFIKHKFFKKDLNDIYHIEKMKEELSIEELDITDYDRELYKLDKRFEPYNVMFNENPREDTLGQIKIKYIKRKNIPKYEVTQRNVKDNYETFITYYLDQSDQDDEKRRQFLDKFSEMYIIGLHWIMDFYMNKNNRKENINKVSVWYYPYYYTPTLFMISQHLKKIYDFNLPETDKKKKFNNYINGSLKNLFSFKHNIMFVDRDKFMNKQEHYLFVNPQNNRDTVKVNEYYLELRKNTDFFPDLKNLANIMFENKEKFMGYMDCKTAMYNSKCKMNESILPAIDFHKYMKFIKNNVGNNRESPKNNF